MRDVRHGAIHHGLLLFLVSAALVGCGSTVPLEQVQSAEGSGQGLGGSAPAADAASNRSELDAANGAASGSQGAGAAGGNAGATNGSGAAGGVTSNGSAPLSSGGSVASRGGTVQVGVTYFKDASAGLAAIGASGGTLGDQLAYAKIVVADANAHGGLGGKKIQPVYFAYDANPGAPSIPDQEAAACATFTQDNKVQLVLAETVGPDLISCLRKKGIPMVGENSFTGSGASRYAAGGVVDLGAFNVDRRAREQVKALKAQRYFSGWNTTTGGPGPAGVRVGVIAYDLPEWRDSVKNNLAPALQEAGFGKPDVVVVAPHTSYDNLSTMSGQLQSAVLQFKANGVTHVIVWDDNGVSTLFFMKAADNQGYRPRYGVNSGNNMNLLVSTSLVPKSQVLGSVGLGWMPIQDIPEADSGPTSKYSNPTRRSCNALMASGGQQGSKYNEYFAQKYCGAMNAIKAAADRGGVGAARLLAALDALGSTVPSPVTPATYVGPRRHDGNGGIYHYAYDPQTNKMVYTSGVISLAR
jgi:hypothetical protein